MNKIGLIAGMLIIGRLKTADDDRYIISFAEISEATGIPEEEVMCFYPEASRLLSKYVSKVTDDGYLLVSQVESYATAGHVRSVYDRFNKLAGRRHDGMRAKYVMKINKEDFDRKYGSELDDKDCIMVVSEFTDGAV